MHELKTYTLLPGKLGDYLELAANAERAVFGADNDKFGKLEGLWYTEFGTLNQAVILVRYSDLNERDLVRADAFKSEEWLRFTQNPPDTRHPGSEHLKPPPPAQAARRRGERLRAPNVPHATGSRGRVARALQGNPAGTRELLEECRALADAGRPARRGLSHVGVPWPK